MFQNPGSLAEFCGSASKRDIAVVEISTLYVYPATFDEFNRAISTSRASIRWLRAAKLAFTSEAWAGVPSENICGT